MLAPVAVREVIQTPVEAIGPDEPVRTAAAHLLDRGTGSLVVSSALARLPGMVIHLSQDVSHPGPVPIDE
jgi:CBS-domain-containing membrane protein